MPYVYIQYIYELYCKFKIRVINTVGGVAETRTVIQYDMVNICVIQGGLFLQK